MPSKNSRKHKRLELPPTAGLPLSCGDFFAKPRADLGPGLRKFLGIPEPILTCSGTAALVVALKTLQRLAPQRRNVIVPGYTCPLTALAVALVPGLRLVPCDLKPHSIDFDPQELARLCDEETLAVLPTHLGGRVADAGAAKATAHAQGAYVIEDAAQAMGAQADGRSVGLCGDIGFFSLAAGKGLTTYEGGALFAGESRLHAALDETARELLRPDFLWTWRRRLELLGYAFFYHPQRLWRVYGRNLVRCLDRGDEVRAVGDYFSLDGIPLHSLDVWRQRVAANALVRLPEFLATGTQRAAGRLNALRELPGMRVLDDGPGATGTWPFFMLLMLDGATRDRALNKLWRAGLGVSKLFVHALPDYEYLRKAGVVEAGDATDLPEARAFAVRLLTVTNSPWLDDDAFARIVGELEGCL